LVGYVPSSSKTNVDVIASGPGTYQEMKLEFEKNVYHEQCLFGGFREGSRFVHFTFVGKLSGAMSRGRASLHKNAVLNELEGCVREENVVQSDSFEDATAAGSSDAPVEKAPRAHAESTQRQEAADEPTRIVSISESKSQFEALTDDEFTILFKMTRGDFEKLPQWKQTNARKTNGLF
jgi:hypothetical protein